jgi:hypothetical protein
LQFAETTGNRWKADFKGGADGKQLDAGVGGSGADGGVHLPEHRHVLRGQHRVLSCSRSRTMAGSIMMFRQAKALEERG